MVDHSLELAYQDRLPILEEAARDLERLTLSALNGFENGHVDAIRFRAKATTSFVRKASAERAAKPYAQPLLEIEDQIAGRILVFFRHDIEAVLGVLKSAFLEVEFSRKAPATLDAFGYESDHLICVIPAHVKGAGWREIKDMPTTFELQVRTLFMHAHAEPQHNLLYKPEVPISDENARRLAWIAASSWGADQVLELVWQELDESPNAIPAKPRP